MFSTQVFRFLTSQRAASLMQKCTMPKYLGTTRDISLLRQNTNPHEKLHIHTSCIHNDECQKKILGKLERKLSISFTCKRCNTRTTKTIAKLTYETGVVIIRCDGCKNNHLIADNLGWFLDVVGHKNIEKILASKSEKAYRLHDYNTGCVQVLKNDKPEAAATFDYLQDDNESREETTMEANSEAKS